MSRPPAFLDPPAIRMIIPCGVWEPPWGGGDEGCRAVARRTSVHKLGILSSKLIISSNKLSIISSKLRIIVQAILVQAILVQRYSCAPNILYYIKHSKCAYDAYYAYCILYNNECLAHKNSAAQE